MASLHSVSCHCSGLSTGRSTSSKLKSVKLLEVLNALEEEESGHSREEIFIAPPKNAAGDFTDEDSGDEDGQRGTHVPGNVLHAFVVPEDSGTGEVKIFFPNAMRVLV